MSLQNLTTPVDPDEFVERFSKKFQNWGNAITEELKETWRQNCLVFNNVIEHKEDATKYIVSAPTGSAKTENTITYCAILPKKVKVLIHTNLIDEVDRIAADINEEAGYEKACAFHSKNELTLKEASRYQIIVSTHAFHTIHVKKSHKFKKLLGNRDLVIIDEALSTLEEVSVDVNSVTIALNFFEALYRDNKFKKRLKANTAIRLAIFMEETQDYEYDDLLRYELELRKLSDELNSLTKILDTEVSGTYKVRSDTMINLADEDEPPYKVKMFKLLPMFMDFIRILEYNKFQYAKLLTGVVDESIDQKIQKNIIKTLNGLNALDKRLAYITAVRGVKSLNTVSDMLPKQSVACLDATADINQLYALREHYHGDLIRVPRVPKVRDYSTVTLHHTSFNTGQLNFTKQVFESLLDDIEFGEKTLFVVNKLNEDTLSQVLQDKYNNFETDIATWGSLTGLNRWKEFDTCVILGLNHKPTQFVQNRVLVNTTEDEAFGTLQSKLKIDIEVSDLVAEMVQAMNRIRIRQVTTSDGKCDSANIYILLPRFNYHEYLNLIEQHMTEIVLNDWSISINYTTLTTFERLIQYLKNNLQSGGKINLKTPRDELGIDDETYRSVIGKDAEQQAGFKEKLSKYGYEIVEINELDKRNRPRKKPTKYIHKI